MLIPLYVLGAGALLAGLVAYDWFVGHDWTAFWGHVDRQKSTGEVLHHAHEVPLWVTLAPLVFALSGIALSYIYYIVMPELPERTVKALPGHLRAVLQQVVLRRDLRRDLRPAGAQRSAASSGRRATARRSTGSAPTTSPRAPRTWRAC